MNRSAMNAINKVLSNVLACTAAWLIATRTPPDEYTVLTSFDHEKKGGHWPPMPLP